MDMARLYPDPIYSQEKSRFTVVYMENNIIINNNTRINAVSHTHSCKSAFASPSTAGLKFILERKNGCFLLVSPEFHLSI